MLILEEGLALRHCFGVRETQNMDMVGALPIQEFDGMVAEVDRNRQKAQKPA
jgi:hypothetical protein